MNRNLMSVVITVSLAVWVIALAASKVHDLLVEHASWTKLIAQRVPVMGTAAGTFKVVEFSDYQCPFCAMADADLAKFVARHPNDVAVYRDQLDEI